MVPFVIEFRETPYGGTLWFRYSNEFTANTTTPPKNTHLIRTRRSHDSLQRHRMRLIQWVVKVFTPCAVVSILLP